MLVSPFVFHSLYLTIFPLSSSHLLFLCGSILSHISMITTSRVGEFVDSHLHLYLPIMSPIDHGPFQYLANYLTTGSRASTIKHLCPLFHHIHLAPKNFHDLQFMLLLVRTHQGFEKIGINKRTMDVVL
jgi:hypothetical protein